MLRVMIREFGVLDLNSYCFETLEVANAGDSPIGESACSQTSSSLAFGVGNF